ncbi:hypothetical protein [Actinomadura sp. 7K507]|uniref:hypothetical protein n=1 Tax=Actinomadura sp. 7K507 TaxID=2530365 RepID=UPI001052E914|nr:hypothetical protein [Actinomadura sp. 7K507]TDC96040.1 hypothetical protein E1285_06360 [Actinomadura sp. 7K507]
MPFQQRVDDAVRAALAEDRSFGDLLQPLMEATRSASPAELTAALPRLAEGIAEAPPNLGGWLAVICGAWIENGADPAPVGPALVRRITEVTAAALAFANAWEEATGQPPPDMEGRPSQQIVDTLVPALEGDAVVVMLAWFALPQYALAGCTLLQTAPDVRASTDDRDLHIRAAGRAAEYHGQMDHYQALLRVLDGERLLVLDRASRRGWTVTIGGIGDNFQLHMLLGGALIGRPGGPSGDRPAPEVLATFLNADAPPEPPTVSSPWNLVDAHGEWIWNEGVPADIPVVNGTRVVVIDPPSYNRSFPAGRRFPMMPATLRVDAEHQPEDLGTWWTHVKPATR